MTRTGKVRALMGLLVLLAACVAVAAPRFDDRAAMSLPETTLELEAHSFEFDAPSAAMEAMLADPADWSPPPPPVRIETGIEYLRSLIRFDRDGWIKATALNWDQDEGWTLWMRRSRTGAAAPSAIDLALTPPEGSGGALLSLGGGTIHHPDPRSREMELNTRRPGQPPERVVRTERLGADGRLLGWSSRTYREGADVEDDEFAIVSRDAHGLAVRARQLRDGTWYDVSIRYFGTDERGQPLRMLRVFRPQGAGEDAAPARADLTLYGYRYDDEAR
ncbi:hypothetical protein [Luteimonas huabeiensis]|uniref:hypothetical protein n=1 Tax=Luteimonas huabeiensis TaxID=1244513 RepID=UPI00126908A3|nr:hypothetical protein [Luteimonas huabeiensis]